MKNVFVMENKERFKTHTFAKLLGWTAVDKGKSTDICLNKDAISCIKPNGKLIIYSLRENDGVYYNYDTGRFFNRKIKKHLLQAARLTYLMTQETQEERGTKIMSDAKRYLKSIGAI